MVNIDADHRLEHTLHTGDTIRAGDYLYTITGDPIGFGGSSVLYPASRSGSELLYAIKECFPITPANGFSRMNGIIRPNSSEDAEAVGALMHFRDRMETERILGQRIRNTNARAIGIWETLEPSAIKVDGREYTDVSDGIFAVLERMDTKGMTFRQLLEEIAQPKTKDYPLRTGGLPKIYTTACMMEQALLALQRVHKAGYLFGDIQDGNVFFSDCHPEAGDIGIGNLLDFGCARELPDGGRTVPVTDACFTTRGFIPPELLDPNKNDGSLNLGPEADIYSVGCLMLRCLVSKYKIRAMGDSPIIGSNTIDGQEARKLGCPESIRKNLNSILKQAMAKESEERYSSADAMLEAILNLKRDTRPPEFLLPPAPGSSESFVEHSRDREIAMFTRALQEKNEVLISGLGGIGKSEIAIQISRSWDSPKGAYFIHYTLSANEEREAMEETLLRMPLSGYRYEPKKKGMSLEQLRREEYLERLEILREQYNGALIVIDNFDRPGYTLAQLMQERSYGEVTSLGVKFLFTTRNTIDWAPEWEVGPLSRTDLLSLMRRWCRNRDLTDEVLLDLIDEVEGHTLTVDLVAKTLEESWGEITPEMLLEALRSSKLSEGDYPDVDHNTIRKGQESKAIRHRELRTDRIYEHLKVLFDLTGMTEEAKTVLCCATLLPTGGMDAPMFRACLKKEEQQALQSLVKRGWLKLAQRLLMIHPVVCDICHSELKPNASICDSFLSSLKSYAQICTESNQLKQIGACFLKTNSREFSGNDTGYFNIGFTLLMDLAQNTHLIESMECLLTMYDSLSLFFTSDIDRYADTPVYLIYISSVLRFSSEYRAIWHVCFLYGYEQYAAYSWKNAERLLHWVFARFPEFTPDTQKHTESSAPTQLEQAIQQEWASIRFRIELLSEVFIENKEAVSPDDDMTTNYDFNEELRCSYSNLMSFYADLDDIYTKASGFIEVCQLQIQSTQDEVSRDKLCQKLIEFIEMLYNEVYRSENTNLRSSVFSLILSISESVFTEKSETYASYCHFAGRICCDLGHYYTSVQYLDKARYILERILPLYDRTLAEIYGYLCSAYEGLEDYANAFSCCKIAVECLEASENATVSDLYAAYKIAFGLSDQLELHEDQIIYLRKIANTGDAVSMNRLANRLIDGDHCPVDYQEALYWLNKSHATGNATGTNNLGWMHLKGYGTPKDISKAVEFFQQAAKSSKSANLHLGRIYLGVHPDAPDFPDTDPQKALSYLLRAKELGADDVDDQIDAARKAIEHT